MTQMTRDRLAQALAGILDPVARRPVVECGRVSGLRLADDGTATAILAIDGLPRGAPVALETAIREALLQLDSVARVRVIQTSERHQRATTGRGGLAEVAHVIAVASGKGGVGKSTVSANLALALARRGLAVGLLDADIHGPSAHILLGIRQRAEATADKQLKPVVAHGLKVLGMGLMADPDRAVAWRGPMISGAMVQMAESGLWGRLDVLVVDMPPGTGDIQISLAQKLKPSGVVLVSTPQALALADAKRAAALFRQLEVPILGAIANMTVLEAAGETAIEPFGPFDASAFQAALDSPLLAALPLDPAVTRASDLGAPLAEGPVARALDTAAASLAARLALS
ncbi:MAG: P-loop NTPase [Sphingomonadaceae bacterium]